MKTRVQIPLGLRRNTAAHRPYFASDGRRSEETRAARSRHIPPDPARAPRDRRRDLLRAARALGLAIKALKKLPVASLDHCLRRVSRSERNEPTSVRAAMSTNAASGEARPPDEPRDPACDKLPEGMDAASGPMPRHAHGPVLRLNLSLAGADRFPLRTSASPAQRPRQAASGMRATMTVPAPGAERISKLPPSVSTRSAMLRTPTP